MGRLTPRARWAVAATVLALAAAVTVSGLHRDWPARQARLALDVRHTSPDEVARLERTLAAVRPRGVYLTVDTVANRLQVRRRSAVLHEAVCSTGTGLELRDPHSDRRWIFETPRGVRTVLGKRSDPVWIRPDWSFIEEGARPPHHWAERVDHHVLGDWALDLGDGYMIHGTLFERFLGSSVTHGCIRLGDDDLAYVYRTTPVGAVVLIY